MAKAIFTHGAILNPRYGPGLIRSSQLRTLKVFQDRLSLGRRVLDLGSTSERHFEDGTIHIVTRGGEVHFAMRGIGTKCPDAVFTEMVNRLLDAVERGDQDTIDQVLATVRSGRSQFAIGAAFLIVFIVIVGGVFGVLMEPLLVDRAGLLIGCLFALGFAVFAGLPLCFAIARMIAGRGQPKSDGSGAGVSFAKMFGATSKKDLKGLSLGGKAHWQVSPPSNLPSLLRALHHIAPVEAILYLEGGEPPREISQFLAAHCVPEVTHVEIGRAHV